MSEATIFDLEMPKNHNRQWDFPDRILLATWATRGEPWEKIALAVQRTKNACQCEFTRMVKAVHVGDEKAFCLEGFPAETLTALREYARKLAEEYGTEKPKSKTKADQVIAQYRETIKHLQRIEEKIDAARRLDLLCLAALVAEDRGQAFLAETIQGQLHPDEQSAVENFITDLAEPIQAPEIAELSPREETGKEGGES